MPFPEDPLDGVLNESIPPAEDTLPPPESLNLPRGRRVIAIGGGRGGVGKTLLAVNLGVYFAQLGREVVLCDADPFGSNLHAVLGLDVPPLISPEDPAEHLEPVATTVPGLSLMPTAFDPFTATPMRRSRRSSWMVQTSRIDADYVLLNLGQSTAPSTLDLFLQADLSLCVATPEPLAVETTYGFCRALFARVLRRALMKERFKLRLIEKTIAGLPPLSTPPEIIAAIKKYDDGVAAVAAHELSGLAPRLVVGQTRLRSDLELGPAMVAVADRHLGMALDYLGHIEHDDAVWLTVRRRRPLLIDSPTSKSARNLERVARRILALLANQTKSPPNVPKAPWRSPAPLTLYEALGVSRAATDDEIRRAYKRQREIYREGSLPVVSVLTEGVLRTEQARIEEAYDTLLDPVRRRAYDLSAFPDDPPVSEQPSRNATGGALAELLMLQAELAREINAETQFSGALLRKVRESQGIELAEIAHRTKISTLHLQAIEGEAFDELPALVYVQGFLREYAKYLKLDPTQVSKTYARRMRDLARR